VKVSAGTWTRIDRNRRLPMKMNYRFSPLSRDEREYLEMILLEEMDVQSWFAVTYCTLFGEEVFLSIQ
jgi:hypothetical protein